MAMFANGMLQQAYQTGDEKLRAQQASEADALSRYLGRYRMDASDQMPMLQRMQEAGRENAQLTLRAGLEEQQARHDLWKQHMDLFWLKNVRRPRQYEKWDAKDRRHQQWATALSGLGQIAAPQMATLFGQPVPPAQAYPSFGMVPNVVPTRGRY